MNNLPPITEQLRQDTLINVPQLAQAFRAPSYPCNPTPFAGGLLKGIAVHGMDWIKTDEAKAILLVLNSMAFGQLFSLDAVDEFRRLSMALKEKEKV